MKRFLWLILITNPAISGQYIDHKGVGLQERVLMRGSDYVDICSQAVEAVKARKTPRIDGCMLYTEGLRTGYGKATTEVVMQVALYNASPTGDDWDAALDSAFYEKLKTKMTRCDLGESTPLMAYKLSAYVQNRGKGADVMASIFYNFLKDQYSECK